MLNESNVTIEVAKGVAETQTATNFDFQYYAIPVISIISILVTGFIAYYNVKKTTQNTETIVKASTQNIITQLHQNEIKESINCLSTKVRRRNGEGVHECMDSVGGIYMYANLKKEIKECLFLFSWKNVPGTDSERLLKFLWDNHDIGWAKNAKISKSDDHKIIHIFKDENSAEIIVDEKKKIATLKIGDGETQDLKVKKENGKLNIYETGKLCRKTEDVISDLITKYISP